MLTKFIRIAVSGKTIDGREITDVEIDQMAETYNPTTYGSRIWLEHIRGVSPDGLFKSYGDVMEVEARDVNINGVARRGLFARLDVTDDLIEMNKLHQKVYTSVEIHPRFPDTNGAYLMGLGITDSPASIGTEKMQLFSLLNQNKDKSLFTDFEQNAIELDAQTDEEKPSLFNFNKLKDSLAQLYNKSNSDVKASIDAVLTEIQKHNALDSNQQTSPDYSAQFAKIDELTSQLTELNEKFLSLETQLNNIPAPNKPRPPADGSNGDIKTDC